MSEVGDQKVIPAAFIRGGTSKAIFFRASDLPSERSEWAEIFLSAMGTPDPNGRQLNGMGGGLSSLSKICVVGPSQQPGIDAEYTFVQVAISDAMVSFAGNCGNISSAVGAFAVDEGIVSRPDGTCTLNLFNVNTSRVIIETFDVRGGKALTTGALSIPGVAGTGSPVKLEFLKPGGATTGKLFPTGNAMDTIALKNAKPVRVSVVDAANLCIFASAEDLGVATTEMPDWLDSASALKQTLVEVTGAVSELIRTNLNRTEPGFPRIGLVGFVAPACDSVTLSAEQVKAEDADLSARMYSSGQAHRALPLTAALCMAVASKIPGTVPHSVVRKNGSGASVRISCPSGVLTVAATVEEEAGKWRAQSASVFRTQRRLFDGQVYVPHYDEAVWGKAQGSAGKIKTSDDE